jgi:hypothetical protein
MRASPLASEAVQQLFSQLRQRRALLPSEADLRKRSRPTGMTPLDTLLGGGLPIGRSLHLLDHHGTLATSVALAVVAHLTAEGHLVGWVDRENSFDARSASSAHVDLHRMLWCQPPTQLLALRAADALMAAGGLPLVVLDLGLTRPRKHERLPEAAWLKLRRRAEAASASLLVLGRPGGPGDRVPFGAATLEPVRAHPRFAGRGPGRTFDGLDLTLSLTHNKLGLPPGEVQISIYCDNST